MKICPACRHENADDTDFCGNCGEYLEWPDDDSAGEATTVAEPGPWPGERDAEAKQAEAVLVTLKLPDGVAGAGAAPAATAAAGGEVRLAALVRNQSEIVDNYDLRVEGLPPGWSTVTPPAVFLVPFGSQESGYEQEVEIALRPPHAPEAEARAWPLRVVAVSRSRPDRTGSASGTLVVEPFRELESALRPRRAAGERSARFALAVTNRGNTPLAVSFAGEDDEAALRFAFRPPQLTLPPGAAGEVQIAVGGDGIVGPDRERAFTIRAAADGATTETSGVFAQQGRAPVSWRSSGRLLALRLVLTLLAAALLIGGSFAVWTPDEVAVCRHGSPSGCLNYATTANDIAGTNIEPRDLPNSLDFVASAGFVTIVLGVLALLGLRKGRSTWLAGFLAVIFLVVLAIQANPEPGIAIPLVGGIAAVVAGFLPVLAREG